MPQMSQDEVRAALLATLEEQAESHGVDIVDVEVAGSAKAPTVRVRIDHLREDEGPITLDEVSEQTGWISDLVDEADPISGSYLLEVSSPGMARPLRKPRDFERFAGQEVSLSLRRADGRRRYTGTLEGLRDGQVCVTTDEGSFSFDLEDVRSCKIRPDFGDAAKGSQRGKGRKTETKR